MSAGVGSSTVRDGSKRLGDISIDWRPGNSACVVLAAEGYPQKPRTGDEIQGLDLASQISDVKIFHAGTTGDGTSYRTAGGRVLGVTATGAALDDALATAYRAANLISWQGMQFRRDIGK